MEALELVKPAKALEAQAMDFLREHTENGEPHINGGAMLEKAESYDAWLQQLQNASSEDTVPDGWVQSSTFFGIRRSDGRIVGMIDIRHRLNDFLAAYGGHIGYGVRPTERGKGYATAMLRLALEQCRSQGIPRAMLSCDKDNSASARTILRCGGVLEREFVYGEDETVQVYWITL